MSTKHTPGPWNIGPRYGNHRTEIVNATGGQAIASVWTHDRKDIGKRPTDRDDYAPTEEGKANLALIAAAPMLLEALKAIADPEHCSTRNTVDGLRRLARGAMANLHLHPCNRCPETADVEMDVQGQAEHLCNSCAAVVARDLGGKEIE